MKLGTRGSDLALEQANIIKNKLSDIGVKAKCNIIETTGDKFKGSIEKANQEGVFVREIDKAVINEEVDAAVHSMKDMPSEMHSDLELAAIPERISPYDVLITNSGKDINEIEEKSVIGTSSARRKAQILREREDIEVESIRGNVDTRIEKFKRGEYDGLVLAKAGIERLSIDINYSQLSAPPFVPSPNQGAIAVISKKGTEASDVLANIDSNVARLETNVERRILEIIGGGCSSPLGILARINTEENDTNREINLILQALSLQGNNELRLERNLNNLKEAEDLAYSVIEKGIKKYI